MTIMISTLEKTMQASAPTPQESAGRTLDRRSRVNLDRVAGLGSPLNGETHWSWSCRRIKGRTEVFADESDTERPRVGDLALVQVETVGFHQRLTTENNRRRRLYRGDRFVGVFGNRYASDAF